MTATLARRLDAALAHPDDGARLALWGAEPADRRDGLVTLLRIHDLHTAPVGDPAVRHQHHPAVAELKGRLEAALLDELIEADGRRGWRLPADPVAALRAVAAADQVPPVYDWLAHQADARAVVDFLSLEGGPDGGFDDLVALAQVGLDGPAKLELATNYWDEMGNGAAAGVHTDLHRTLARSLGLRAVPRAEQPEAALARSALGTLLATNRWLQPELLGALGLIELQAGPRCRRVLTALRRVGAAPDAFPFYEVHATVDPHHGRQWLEHVVAPLAAADPAVGARMVTGARWRSTANAAFFDAVARALSVGPGTGLGAAAPSAATRRRTAGAG